MNRFKNKDKGSIFAKFMGLLGALLILFSFGTFIFNADLSAYRANNQTISYSKIKNLDEFTNNKDEKIEIHFLDVGQGDSCLIIEKQNSKLNTILVDAGPDNKSIKLLKELKKYNVRKINSMILTHPHNDHIGGADEVINKYPIDNLYLYNDKKYIGTEKINDFDLKNAINSHKDKIKLHIPKTKETICYGNLKLRFINNIKKKYDKLNNCSLVTMLEFYNKRILLTGDAEKEEEIWITHHNNVNCDILKVSHHGSKTSSCSEFIKECSPEYAIISCEKNNEYGHPHKQTLMTLNRYMNKRNILNTKNKGTISFYIYKLNNKYTIKYK